MLVTRLNGIILVNISSSSHIPGLCNTCTISNKSFAIRSSPSIQICYQLETYDKLPTATVVRSYTSTLFSLSGIAIPKPLRSPHSRTFSDSCGTTAISHSMKVANCRLTFNRHECDHDSRIPVSPFLCSKVDLSSLYSQLCLPSSLDYNVKSRIPS